MTTQFPPRLHNDIYPFIHPSKYRTSLVNRVTIITGAAGAIGQGLAESFAVAGAHLVLTYNSTPPPSALRERCLKFGAASVTYVKCNVAELGNCEGLIEQIVKQHGRIDILVNNAGANGLGPLTSQPPQNFIHDVAVNFHGPYYLMRLALPHMRTQKSGVIINIASRAGTVFIPYSASYCASKAALINLTGCVQKEMDVEGLEDVVLYSVHPGGVKSVMTVKKYGEESVKNVPEHARGWFSKALDSGLYDDSPYLNGMVCVALATGVGKDVLKGRYIDVGHDLEDILTQGEALKSKEGEELYTLHTSFLGGLKNGLPEVNPDRKRFEFPGFEV